MDEMPPREPSSQPNESLTRGGFYIGAIYGMGAAIMAALGVPALAYLLLPPKLRKGDEGVAAGEGTGWEERRVGGSRRHHAVDSRCAGGNYVSPEPRGWLEDHQRKDHGLGGEACGQYPGGIRAAVYAPGMRLPLGRE